MVPGKERWKSLHFNGDLSLIILLSWRGPWCIKWCQYHKAECDLEGDGRALHMCQRGHSHFLGSQNLHPKSQPAVSWTERTVYGKKKHKLTTVNFSASLLFPSSYYFFHILSFMSWMTRSSKEWAAINESWSHSMMVNHKSSVAVSPLQLGKGGWVSGHWMSTHPSSFFCLWPACSREPLPWWGGENGNIQHSVTQCSDIFCLSSTRSRDRKVGVIMKVVIKVWVRLNPLHLSRVPSIDFSPSPRDM